MAVGGVPDFPVYHLDSNFTAQVLEINGAITPDSGFMAKSWPAQLHRTMLVIGKL